MASDGGAPFWPGVTTGGSLSAATAAKTVVRPATRISRWAEANGVEETGQIQADAGLTAGTRVQIWLDRSGVVTSAPVSTTTAAVQAVIVATVCWVGLGCLLAGIFWIVRVRLNRARFANWESEWRQIGPQWTTH